MKESQIIPHPPANDLLRGKKKRRRETKWADKGERRTNTFPAHILFIMSERRGEGMARSFNYCPPSQANIPACQGPFWLSFGQSSSDGPHFLLNRTRRRLQKWRHLILWPGGEGNIKTPFPQGTLLYSFLPLHQGSKKEIPYRYSRL